MDIFFMPCLQNFSFDILSLMDSFEKVVRRRFWILIHSLIISGTLNIALIATFVTFVLKDRKVAFSSPVTKPPSHGKRISLTSREVIQSFHAMSYEELVAQLDDETHIEEGQRRCDLALAFLGASHYFDVERAFAGYPVETREILLDDGQKLTLYSGLSQGRLAAVRTFAKVELWPLTPEGLFRKIKERDEVPLSLKKTFENTTEYFLIKRAFHRLPYRLSEEALFSFITEGNWEEIKSLAEEIQNSSDGKISDFIPLLVSRIEQGSSLAAHLLVLLEKEYALKKLDDSQLEKLLILLTDITPEIEVFLSEVKNGLRSLSIQELAGKPLENAPRCHIVQPGDSLWKISRDYGATVTVIKEMNGLESEHLKPGMKLILPP